MRRLIGRAALAGATFSALALGVAITRTRARDAERRFPPVGVLVDAGDAGIHVLDAGEGTPVVLVHGADGVMQEFTETVFAHIARSTRAVAFDRPGHGWSSSPDGEPHDLATNVRALRAAARACGIGPAVLVGHSYGALVVLRWALDHPEDVLGLVLLSPPGSWSWPVPPAVFGLPSVPVLGPVLVEALTGTLGPFVLCLSSARGFAPGRVPPAYTAYSTAFFLRPSQVVALAGEYRSLADDVEALVSRCSRVAIPVEIVVGRDDRVVPPRRHAEVLARAIPTARLTILPGVGHELQWEASEAVLAAVRRVRARAGV